MANLTETLKTALYSGVGFALLTKDKIKELSQELVKRGDLTEKEGKELVQELIEKSKTAQKALEGKVEEATKGLLAKLNLATKDDISALHKKIDTLMKNQGGSAKKAPARAKKA